MTDALLEHPRLRTLMSRAAREVADVAKATGANRASILQWLWRSVRAREAAFSVRPRLVA